MKTLGVENLVQPIKRTINNTKYEVYLPTLQTFELSDIVSQGVTLRNKVMTTVGTATHRGLSLYEVYSRSLSPVLLSEWEQADNDPLVNNTATVNHFVSRLREMIAVLKSLIHSHTSPFSSFAMRINRCHTSMAMPAKHLRFNGRSCPHTTPVESWGRM
jgi:hypothetical protein